jgi:hypothetical protein
MPRSIAGYTIRAPGPCRRRPDAVRIEPLARALGVTKGGFYWHFDDRRALLEELLDTGERVSIDEVIERVEGEGGDARTRLRRRSAWRSRSKMTTRSSTPSWCCPPRSPGACIRNLKQDTGLRHCPSAHSGPTLLGRDRAGQPVPGIAPDLQAAGMMNGDRHP